MRLFTIHLEPECLGKTQNGAVRPKNLIDFLDSIPESRIQTVGLYVDHSGVMIKVE